MVFFGPPCDDPEKLYDAVIFHSPKDIDYVIKHIANEFESGRPPNLRLCLQYRDLNEDASYIQLLETACASRKIVILLTRNFLQTEWARFDVRRAMHEALRGRPYKLVIIEDSDASLEAENDIELVPYLKASGVARIRRNDQNFVDKLRYAMPMEVAYRGNNYTLDHMSMPPYMTQPNHHHHHHLQHSMTQPRQNSIKASYPNCTATMNGVMMYTAQRQAPPPAYCPELDETNYSSATTASPSLHPSRQNILAASDVHQATSSSNNIIAQPTIPQNLINKHHHHPNNQQRPLSEHIYSSIDSDYSTLDCENQLLQPQLQQMMTPQHHYQSSNDSTTALNRSTNAAATATCRANGNLPNGQQQQQQQLQPHFQAYLV